MLLLNFVVCECLFLEFLFGWFARFVSLYVCVFLLLLFVVCATLFSFVRVFKRRGHTQPVAVVALPVAPSTLTNYSLLDGALHLLS